MSSDTREMIRRETFVSSNGNAAAVSGIRSPSYIQVRLPSRSLSIYLSPLLPPSLYLGPIVVNVLANKESNSN